MKKWCCLVDLCKSSYLRSMEIKDIICNNTVPNVLKTYDGTGRVATIGFFDGVHRGHVYLLAQLWKVAKERGLRPLVVTFDVHPRAVLQSDFQPQLLTSLEEKVGLLHEVGFDDVAVLHFTREMGALSPREFMHEILRKELDVKFLLMGYDHRFGHGGGTHEEYIRWGREEGIEVLTADRLPGEKVSSSVIRHLLSEGRVEDVCGLLGRPYELSGSVVHGQALGRRIGFPTANVCPSQEKLCPASGVYAVRVKLADGSSHGGMLCVGSRPTLDDGRGRTIEVHLFDFDGDLYDKSLTIAFHSFLREEMKFETVSDLQQQLLADKALAERALNY